MKKVYELELRELDGFVKDVLSEFSGGVIVLRGDLAAGKTTLVKEFAKQLDCSEEVTSPTFSLQQCYGEKIFHYDIYNHGLEHFISLGMLEELEKDGLHFIEWGDEALIELLESVGIDVMSIDINKISDKAREYSVCIH
ncbi:tRNA (adenosine(37)-N6)-threonylcarbamoyltransferase complex ATPase subunit type 1 TsaE [Sulfurimonas paralvinellae]|uniref:tRNA threonylcarbamoyladenosine biosynthesis protein TsaE n=1 Tax=Sulfurimonas paralvinellae TaxID=317658 RepID=A0A7M1B7N7_9BACT|nr:tRNA (adenosine(37)-N6)-threonylcarbamoyltransferase complex ATPase subunit type 1 TsaE [Sulfurimonas paralvinellae]QOP45747.1 tRNA (adenosine(37)-N6)-threonylcarbamoyltransferase complex ATPase subunit type 1 TsaE [Sulfurimonas paralvinellae]